MFSQQARGSREGSLAALTDSRLLGQLVTKGLRSGNKVAKRNVCFQERSISKKDGHTEKEFQASHCCACLWSRYLGGRRRWILEPRNLGPDWVT